MMNIIMDIIMNIIKISISINMKTSMVIMKKVAVNTKKPTKAKMKLRKILAIRISKILEEV